jgi:hypothetical protein
MDGATSMDVLPYVERVDVIPTYLGLGSVE